MSIYGCFGADRYREDKDYDTLNKYKSGRVSSSLSYEEYRELKSKISDPSRSYSMAEYRRMVNKLGGR